MFCVSCEIEYRKRVQNKSSLFIWVTVYPNTVREAIDFLT